MDEDWWINRHKLNIRDFLIYVERYFAGEYPEELLKARLKDYQQYYMENNHDTR